MDLVLNSITILSGSPAWDTQDDLEFFAFFCSKECMMKYLGVNLDEDNRE